MTNHNLRHINILLFEPDILQRKVIIDTLLMHGYLPKSIDTLSEAPSLLKSDLFPFFIVHINPEDPSTQAMLETFMHSRATLTTRVVLHVRNPTEEFLVKLIKMGFHFFITKPFESATFITKLNQIVTSTAPGFLDKRRHVRVPVPSYINGKVMLTNIHKRKITGNIVDISAGGLSIQFNEDRSYGHFSAGDILRNSMLLLKDIDIFVNLKVISSTREITRLQYLGVEEDKHQLICSFIYDRLDESGSYKAQIEQ